MGEKEKRRKRALAVPPSPRTRLSCPTLISRGMGGGLHAPAGSRHIIPAALTARSWETSACISPFYVRRTKYLKGAPLPDTTAGKREKNTGERGRGFRSEGRSRASPHAVFRWILLRPCVSDASYRFSISLRIFLLGQFLQAGSHRE